MRSMKSTSVFTIRNVKVYMKLFQSVKMGRAELGGVVPAYLMTGEGFAGMGPRTLWPSRGREGRGAHAACLLVHSRAAGAEARGRGRRLGHVGGGLAGGVSVKPGAESTRWTLETVLAPTSSIPPWRPLDTGVRRELAVTCARTTMYISMFCEFLGVCFIV